MKKIYSYLALFLVLFLAGCNLNSSDENKTVSSSSKLPLCSPSSETFKTYSNLKVYVEDEELFYLCTESGWVLSDSTTVSDTTSVFVPPDTTQTYFTESISGSVTGYGPIIQGSFITIKGMKKNPITGELSYENTIGTDEISTKAGEFVSSNLKFANDYAMLSVNGYFLDPVTGVKSEDSLLLKALIDLSEPTDIKLDVYSTITVPRIMRLIKNGYSFDSAKEQAEKELMDAFGLNPDYEISSAALAIAVLLRNNDSFTNFKKSLDSIGNDFAKDGVINDEKTKVALADFAFNLENNKLRNEETDEVVLKTSDIRKNLETWFGSSVPSFESYLTKYWNNVYGLGPCLSSRQNQVLKNSSAESDSADAYFICNSDSWIIASDFERDTCGLGNTKDGVLKEGSINSDKTYMFDTTGTGAGTPTRWVKPDSITLVIGFACTDEKDVKDSFKLTKDSNKVDNYWACSNRHWISITKTSYDIGILCSESEKDKQIRLNGDDEYEYYRCGDPYGFFDWIKISKIDYETAGKTCDKDKLLSTEESHYVCIDTEKSTFREATERETDLGKPCSNYTLGATGVYDEDKYICACSVYNEDSSAFETETDVDKCSTALISWMLAK